MKNISEQRILLDGSNNPSEKVVDGHKAVVSTGLGNLQPRDNRGQLIDLITGRPYPANIDSQMVLDKSAQDNSDKISTSPYGIRIFSRDRLPDDTGVYARAHRED